MAPAIIAVSMRILVVEDEPKVASFVRRALEAEHRVERVRGLVVLGEHPTEEHAVERAPEEADEHDEAGRSGR